MVYISPRTVQHELAYYDVLDSVTWQFVQKLVQSNKKIKAPYNWSPVGESTGEHCIPNNGFPRKGSGLYYVKYIWE